MKISVIICTRNRPDDLKRTISSILKQSRLPDEFIVVDSSDEPSLAGYLNSSSLPFPVRYFHTAPGLTLQRNIGIRNSSTDALCFFDDDVELDVDYLDQIERVFSEDGNHNIGAVGGRIKNTNEVIVSTLKVRLEKAVFGWIRFIFGLEDYGSGKYRLSGMPTFPHKRKIAGMCETLTGCCMAFRREVFDRIEFDEKLPGYGLMEDVDISKRTLDAGYGIFYEPSAALNHNESPRNRLNYFQWAEMSVINYEYLFRKNWSRDTFRWPFYYWALLGLVVINFHNRSALLGTISGLKKIHKNRVPIPVVL